MKVKRYWKKILSLVLTSALLLGLLPTAAFAYSPDEKTDIIEFKAMVLENLTGGTVSEYQYLTTDNTFYSDINMNGYTDEDGEYGYSWTMLSYTIEKTQPVNLMLYRMNDDTEYAYGDTVNLTHSESPEADEPFIGEFIGYLHGTPLLDENGEPFIGDIPEEDLQELIWQAVWGGLPSETIKEYTAFGFTGEELDISNAIDAPEPTETPTEPKPTETPTEPEPTETPTEPKPTETPTEPEPTETPAEPEPTETPAEPEPTETPAEPEPTETPTEPEPSETPTEPEPSETPTEPEPSEDSADPGPGEVPAEQKASAAPVMLESSEEPAEPEPTETPAEPEPTETPAEPEPTETPEEPEPTETPAEPEPTETPAEPEPTEMPAEPEPIETPVEPEPTPVETEPQVPQYTEADVLIDRGANGLFRADTDEGAYTKNYLLWDGLIETEDGALTYCNLESGNYVIVMQPTTPGAEKYRSFLAFSQNSERQDQFLNSDAWSELEAMAEKYGWTVDPVDLLTGSFKWEYQDLALYGKDDLPFIRYYNSSDFEDDHGLGLGWSSNYTAFLDIENLFVRAILPNGRELYFNLNFDDTFRPVGDCTLEWAGGEFLLKNTSDGTSYAFTKEGDLARIDYLNGNTVQFSYTGDQLTEISNASGSLLLEYTGGHISRITDSTGRSITLTYDGDYLSQVDNPDGNSFSYTYEDGCLTEVSNLKGEVYVQNVYDSQGRVVHQEVANMGVFDFTYDTDNRVNTCTGTDGYLLEIHYDELGRITRSTNAEGTARITYNEENQVTSETDREGNTTRYTHDEAGNISRITYPDGTTEALSIMKTGWLRSLPTGTALPVPIHMMTRVTLPA